MTEIIWQGLDAWIERVAKLPESVPQKAKSIMSDIGEEAKGVMDERTPVWKGKPDRHHEPGKLKEGNTLTPTEDGFELSNAVEYAKYVEYGTRKMSAEPFLQPAIEAGAKAMEEQLPKALEG